MQIVVASLAHQLPRIFAVQNESCGFEHWGRFRGVGDTMQRIYADGKVGLGQGLDGWAFPRKEMNHA
jgi:hypothetical protein